MLDPIDRMDVRREALRAADMLTTPMSPVDAGATAEDFGPRIPDLVYTEQTGEAGMRDSDVFGWRQTGETEVTIINMASRFGGTVTTYADEAVSLTGVGTTYVGVNVAWTKDAAGVVTGGSVVELHTASDLTGVSGTIPEDEGDYPDGGVSIPILRFSLVTVGENNIAVVDRYYHFGMLELDGPPPPNFICDTHVVSGIDQESIELIKEDGIDADGVAYTQRLQLRYFDVDDDTDGDMLTADDESWTDPTTGKTSEKVLVRKRTATGVYRLKYKNHNPLPDGSDTKVLAKWDSDGYKKALPISLTPKLLDSPLVGEDYVVVGAGTAEAGDEVIQLQMAPLSKFLILADGDSSNKAVKWTGSSWKPRPIKDSDNSAGSVGNGSTVLTAVSEGANGLLCFTAGTLDVTAVPNGSGANIALKWNGSAWTAVPPLGTAGSSGSAGDGASVVTSLEVDATGLIKANVGTLSVPATPSGYSEVPLNVVTDSGIYTGTFLVKSGSLGTAFSSSQERYLLQISSAGKVTVDKGYLAS